MYDFIFTSAKLWKDRNVYVGEWINTIKYLETIFMRGGLHGFQYKTSQVNLIEQLRWRLKWAERFCKRNPDFKLLYPSMYFDVSRKASFEGGFRYTLKHYKRHVTSTENYAKKKRLYSGELTYKIRFKVLEYLNNKISFERLTDYVRRLEYRNHRQKNSLSYTLHNIIIVEREKIKHAQE